MRASDYIKLVCLEKSMENPNASEVKEFIENSYKEERSILEKDPDFEKNLKSIKKEISENPKLSHEVEMLSLNYLIDVSNQVIDVLDEEKKRAKIETD